MTTLSEFEAPSATTLTQPSVELTPSQREAVAFRGGNLLVEAVPGSGKTAVIVACCLALLKDGVPPSEMLLLTFSRRAVGVLRTQLALSLEPEKMPEVRTFHGFAARLLADAGEAGRSRRLLSEPSERALFERTIETTHLETLQGGVVHSALFRDVAAARVAELRRAPSDALTKLATRARPRLGDLIALEAEQKRLRERLGVADYDDLIARAVLLGATPGHAVANALRGRYRHVLVDEFQDTDAVQLELLERLGATIFAVGDAAQAIYGFRGASRDALDRAREALSMRSLPLSDSFRCPEEICALARSVQPDSTLKSSGTRTGELVFRRAASPRDEATFIADSIVTAIAAGTKEREIAVLVRATEPMAGLVEHELQGRGIDVARDGGENVLADLTVDAIRAALEAFANPTMPAAWERVLGHPAFAIAPLGLRLALAAAPPRSLEEACRLLEGACLEARIPGVELSAALRAAHAKWTANEPIRAGRTFANESNLLGFAIENDENAIRRSSAAVASFFAAFGDVRYVREKLGLDMSSSAVFNAFVACSEAWRPAGGSNDDEPGVRVLTIHAAKGLEFDFVAIADAVEDHFPQAFRADALLGSEDLELARDCGVDLGTLANEHDAEERSLWYVAVTRAKCKLVVTWSETGLDGTPQRPSRFVPLAERTRQADEKSFRGNLNYDNAPSVIAPQLPSTACLARDVRTSAMETWLSCRRKFYYEALLRIETDDRGFAVKLGNLVHAAVERFHTAVRDFRDVPEAASAAWTGALQRLARELIALGDAAEPSRGPAFDTKLEREGALRSADRLLARYARSLETSARSADGGFVVEAVEESVRFEVERIGFRGKIDRIDRRLGGLTLVDVKTGKAKEHDMVVAFEKLRTAVAGETLREKGPISGGNPQLALYRYAKPETSALEFLFLGADPKNRSTDAAHVDRLDVATDAVALQAIDTVLTETFFKPWTTDAIDELEPTKIAQTCKLCNFVRICPGFLEDDD